MPLDPQAKAMIDQMRATGARPRNTMTPEEARQDMIARKLPSGPPEPVAHVENRTIPGPVGPLPVRIYTPDGARPLPVLVYFHGGGWVLGNLNTHDAPCRMLANTAGCIVVSVDYPLAPEHKFPIPVEAAYTATKWAYDNAESMGGDPTRVAVSGNSAGGNLAAVVALMAKDRDGPPLIYQLLMYPNTDHNFDTPSCLENAEGYMLTRDEVIYFSGHYLRNEADRENPYAAPLRAPDLHGLPPAFVVTAEYDPLRDEGKAYADRLREAGVPTIYVCQEGMIHGFFRNMASQGQGKDAVRDAAVELRKVFANTR